MDPGVSLNNCSTVTIVGVREEKRRCWQERTSGFQQGCLFPNRALDLELLEWDVVWLDIPELRMKIRT